MFEMQDGVSVFKKEGWSLTAVNMERGRSKGGQDEGTGKCTSTDRQREEKGRSKSLVDGAQISFALLATDHKKRGWGGRRNRTTESRGD